MASSSNPLFPLAPPPLPPPAAAFRNGLEVFPLNLDDPPDTDIMKVVQWFPAVFPFFQQSIRRWIVSTHTDKRKIKEQRTFTYVLAWSFFVGRRSLCFFFKSQFFSKMCVYEGAWILRAYQKKKKKKKKNFFKIKTKLEHTFIIKHLLNIQFNIHFTKENRTKLSCILASTYDVKHFAVHYNVHLLNYSNHLTDNVPLLHLFLQPTYTFYFLKLTSL